MGHSKVHCTLAEYPALPYIAPINTAFPGTVSRCSLVIVTLSSHTILIIHAVVNHRLYHTIIPPHQEVSMEPVSCLVIVRIHQLIPSFKNVPSKINGLKEECGKSLRMRTRTGPSLPVTSFWVGHVGGVVAFGAHFTVPTRGEG